MKNISFFILSLFFGFSAFAQYSLSFTHPIVKDGKFWITVNMAATEHSFYLGNHNLRFNYPTEYLSNPVIVNTGKHGSQFALTNMNVVAGLVGINAAALDNAKEFTISQAGTDLLTLQFDIVKPTDAATLNWRVQTRTASTVVLDEENQVLTQANEVSTMASTFDLQNQRTAQVFDRQMQISPNPVSTNVNIHFIPETLGNVTLKLTDMMGKQVYTQTFANDKSTFDYDLDMQNLPSGIYFLVILDGNDRHIETLMKN